MSRYDKKINNILNKMAIEEALNKAKYARSKFTLDQQDVHKKIKEMNMAAKRDKNTIFTGITIFLLAIIGLIASTSIIMSAGIRMYKGHSVAFVISMLFVELVLFKANTILTTIKHSFNSHYLKVKTIQIGLLGVLIYYNYNFFYPFINDKGILLQITTFILCFLMEFATMQLVSLANDLRHLNYTYQEKSNDIESNTSILKMIIFNLTYKARITALMQYKQNIKQYKQVVEGKEVNPGNSEDSENIYIETHKMDEDSIKQLEESKVKVDQTIEIEKLIEDEIEDPEVKEGENKKTEKQIFRFQPKEATTLKDIENYFKYLLEVSNGNIAKGYKGIVASQAIDGLTQYKALEIIKFLKKCSYLETNPDNQRQTLIKKAKFDKNDFVNVVMDNS